MDFGGSQPPSERPKDDPLQRRLSRSEEPVDGTSGPERSVFNSKCSCNIERPKQPSDCPEKRTTKEGHFSEVLHSTFCKQKVFLTNIFGLYFLVTVVAFPGIVQVLDHIVMLIICPVHNFLLLVIA